MKTSRRIINRAARLYMLANMACMDAGGAETEEETEVVHKAIELAREKLARLDIEWTTLVTLQACIEFAKREKGK